MMSPFRADVMMLIPTFIQTSSHHPGLPFPAPYLGSFLMESGSPAQSRQPPVLAVYSSFQQFPCSPPQSPAAPCSQPNHGRNWQQLVKTGCPLIWKIGKTLPEVSWLQSDHLRLILPNSITSQLSLLHCVTFTTTSSVCECVLHHCPPIVHQVVDGCMWKSLMQFLYSLTRNDVWLVTGERSPTIYHNSTLLFPRAPGSRRRYPALLSSPSCTCK